MDEKICEECGDWPAAYGLRWCLDCCERIDGLRLAWAEGYAAGHRHGSTINPYDVD